MKAEVYWVTEAPVRLAVLPRPRGGDYLVDEIASLHDQGLDVLVSLLTEDECDELDLGGEEQACKEHSVKFISFPIEDRSVPPDAAAATSLVRDLRDLLVRHQRVGIHCRAGIGRSAMLAAAVLAGFGFSPDAAFERISDARGCEVPDTSAQRTWVERFVRGDEH
ncbi:MAG: tyrosine protein phosphatase [Planctomycetota bacterium]|nr:tyrosine protein phosphatase [Planctomycetota bacterium]